GAKNVKPSPIDAALAKLKTYQEDLRFGFIARVGLLGVHVPDGTVSKIENLLKKNQQGDSLNELVAAAINDAQNEKFFAKTGAKVITADPVAVINLKLRDKIDLRYLVGHLIMVTAYQNGLVISLDASDRMSNAETALEVYIHSLGTYASLLNAIDKGFSRFSAKELEARKTQLESTPNRTPAMIQELITIRLILNPLSES
ncbi:MAG: hypothetical protein ACXVA9_06130, partial [Bdellovibrionales bacterium]